jgi:hypothetical protein
MISDDHQFLIHQNSIIELADSHSFGPGNMLEKLFNEVEDGYSAKSSQSNLTSHRREDVFNKVRKLNKSPSPHEEEKSLPPLIIERMHQREEEIIILDNESALSDVRGCDSDRFNKVTVLDKSLLRSIDQNNSY